MTTGSINDRRRFTQEQLEAMASRPGAEHPAALRQITASMLGFNTVNDAVIAPEHPQLPTTATVIATLSNSYGPDYIGIHFDMTTLDRDRPRSGVTNVQVQAANDLAQRYAGEESYPLLIFTLPDNSGVQFVTGNPEPSNHHRLRDVVRVTAHWNGLNRTALDCLERVGNAIVNGDAPQRAFRAGFDIQPVTNEFFTDYKANYDAAVALMEPSTGKEQAGQFVQTMFNRLLFIHFISRKGWLKFNGDTDYLNALWKDYQANSSQSNFYTDRLTALFFDGLNNPQAHNLMRDNPELCALIGEPPFLNGGLFEPTQLDDNAAKGDFTVPDEAIAPLITGLFNNYNFTVTEATPLDTEVAVDPEMLGKLFEETVNERHSNGAYYTPRPVVSFMCREAIKGYLSGKGISSLDDAKIVNLVDLRNPDAITPQQALEIANAVAGMKVVDPACGSGAFLLGMLQETLALNDSLFRAGHTAESMYRQKLDIITNNIYGADKDGLAVSTAMLRLWLSLAVDYDSDGPPPPLPNLDLKLLAGDTIAGPDPQQLDFTRESIVKSGLRNDNAAYTTAHGQQKEELKQRVDKTKEQLRSTLKDAAPPGVVEWRIDFADVMLNGGFDVVIANPPYVVVKDDESKKKYREMYKEGVFGRMNLYGLFIQRSLQLLREDGQLQFINPRSLLTDSYFTNLRKVIKQKSELRGVTLIADRRSTFARVLQECIILHLSKKAAPGKSYLVYTRAITTPEDLNSQEERKCIDSKRVLLSAAHQWAFFIGASEFEYEVFERMAAKKSNLGSLALKAETGKVQFDKYKEFAQETDEENACRLIWAENVQRYHVRETRKRAGKEWLSKEIAKMITPNITGAGIITQRITANEQPRRIIATSILPSEAGTTHTYAENHTNFIQLNDTKQRQFILATLNSSLAELIFRRLNSNTQVSAGELNALPLPPLPDPTTLEEIDDLVRTLMKSGGVDVNPSTVRDSIAIEIKLDNIIGKLYGFSESEVERIRALLPSYEEVYGI